MTDIIKSTDGDSNTADAIEEKSTSEQHTARQQQYIVPGKKTAQINVKPVDPKPPVKEVSRSIRILEDTLNSYVEIMSKPIIQPAAMAMGAKLLSNATNYVLAGKDDVLEAYYNFIKEHADTLMHPSRANRGCVTLPIKEFDKVTLLYMLIYGSVIKSNDPINNDYVMRTLNTGNRAADILEYIAKRAKTA